MSLSASAYEAAPALRSPFFNLLKPWRGLATRDDKHAAVYRAGAVLAAIITWLRS